MPERARRVRIRTWGWVLAWVVLAGTLTGVTVLWRTGALAGTVEANLLARAATVVRTGSDAGLDALTTPGSPNAEYLQAWDPADRSVTYRSPTLGGRDLPYPDPVPTGIRNRLFLGELPDGTPALAAVARVPDAAGRSRTVAYLVPRGPFDSERLRLGLIAGVFWFSVTGFLGGLLWLRRG